MWWMEWNRVFMVNPSFPYEVLKGIYGAFCLFALAHEKGKIISHFLLQLIVG